MRPYVIIHNDVNIDLVTQLYKVLGCKTRLKILYLLINHEKNVSEIAESLTMSTSAISHQLKELRLNNMVKAQKKGQQVYYSTKYEDLQNLLTQSLFLMQKYGGKK